MNQRGEHIVLGKNQGPFPAKFKATNNKICQKRKPLKYSRDIMWSANIYIEGAKNVSWPWLSPLRGWGSPTMTYTGKFVYI